MDMTCQSPGNDAYWTQGDSSPRSIQPKFAYWSDLLRGQISTLSSDCRLILNEILGEIFENPDSANLLFINTDLYLNQSEKEELVRFLAPDGPLFAFLDKLFIENLQFSIPLSSLSHVTQEKIRANEISDYLRRKIDFANSSIYSHAFDYYFYRFFDSPYSALSPSNANFADFFDINRLDYENGGVHCLYEILFFDYLSYFLPLDRFLSSLLVEDNRNRIIDYGQSAVVRPKLHSAYGLIRREILENVVSTPQEQNVHLPRSRFLTKSWNFVQIFTDFWLIKTKITRLDAYLTLLIRLAVDHMFKFVYHSSSVNQADSQLVDFKENLISTLLAPRLAKFFDLAFSKWPLDASFFVVCDLWLAFLQPWQVANRIEPSKFDTFIDRYFIFYEKFFKLIISRLLRTDLYALKTVDLAYKVLVTFGQSNLIDRLRAVSRANFRNFNQSDPFLDQKSIKLLQEFDRKLNLSMISIEHNLNRSAERSRLSPSSGNRSILNRINNLFSADFDENSENFKARELYERLKMTNDLLRATFNLPYQDYTMDSHKMAADDSTLYTSNLSFSSGTYNTPERRLTPDGRLKLTPKGRYQILNQLCALNFGQNGSYLGHSESQTSPKFEFLAKFWDYVAYLLNKRYGHVISKAYDEPGLVGSLCRPFLYRPSSDVMNPQLSLHFLATYKFFYAYFMFIFFLWLFLSINPFLFFAGSLIFVAVFLFFMLVL